VGQRQLEPRAAHCRHSLLEDDDGVTPDNTRIVVRGRGNPSVESFADIPIFSTTFNIIYLLKI